jgi:hypothetical protein
VLVRGPGQRLDCGHMFGELVNRRGHAVAPNIELVVIAPRAQLLLVLGPLKSTNLRFVG